MTLVDDNNNGTGCLGGTVVWAPTLYLCQAALLLLRVLSDPPQVVQLRLQELALSGRLQPQVALLGQLRLQLADPAPQRLAQAATLQRERKIERGESVSGSILPLGMIFQYVRGSSPPA